MDRRSFLRCLAAGLVVPKVEPVVKYFLPPEGGWRPRQAFPQLMMPGLREIYNDFLTEQYLTSPSAWFLLPKAYGEARLRLYKQVELKSVEWTGVWGTKE